MCFIVAMGEIEESKWQKENSMMIEFEFVDIFLLLTLTTEDFVSAFFAHSLYYTQVGFCSSEFPQRSKKFHRLAIQNVQ